ncbi:hypothetical protein BJ508DRAFT_366095 [Ascobolus immersus RN42]|uniref:Uncharacterized protein n=1 Tax=Ascobolus immersus RN42 TaxID=1160509 RepID=A0A3N4HSA1_ASCIM|nr:hypothetical protein BJ508DRAFT_366095 [Ascobolus immersus RN42]
MAPQAHNNPASDAHGPHSQGHQSTQPDYQQQWFTPPVYANPIPGSTNVRYPYPPFQPNPNLSYSHQYSPRTPGNDCFNVRRVPPGNYQQFPTPKSAPTSGQTAFVPPVTQLWYPPSAQSFPSYTTELMQALSAPSPPILESNLPLSYDDLETHRLYLAMLPKEGHSPDAAAPKAEEKDVRYIWIAAKYDEDKSFRFYPLTGAAPDGSAVGWKRFCQYLDWEVERGLKPDLQFWLPPNKDWHIRTSPSLEGLPIPLPGTAAAAEYEAMLNEEHTEPFWDPDTMVIAYREWEPGYPLPKVYVRQSVKLEKWDAVFEEEFVDERRAVALHVYPVAKVPPTG